MTRTVGSLPGRAELQAQLHLDEENFNAIFARASAIVGAAELTRFFDASQYGAAYNEQRSERRHAAPAPLWCRARGFL